MDFPKGVAWAATGNFEILRLVGRWLRHGSGAIERVAWQLTRMGCSLIVRGIPEGHMLGDISLIFVLVFVKDFYFVLVLARDFCFVLS